MLLLSSVGGGDGGSNPPSGAENSPLSMPPPEKSAPVIVGNKTVSVDYGQLSTAQVNVTGAPDFPHEGPQAIEMAELLGGGDIQFSSVQFQPGYEGYFTPTGGSATQFSLKQATGGARAVERNFKEALEKAANAGVSNALLDVKADGVTVAEMSQQIQKYPTEFRKISNGIFENALIRASDGTIIISNSSQWIRIIQP